MKNRFMGAKPNVGLCCCHYIGNLSKESIIYIVACFTFNKLNCIQYTDWEQMFPPIQHLSAHLPPGGGIYNYTPLPPLLFDPSPLSDHPWVKFSESPGGTIQGRTQLLVYSVFLHLNQILCITNFSQLRPK
jgi:hypothetical protein